ncbi:hypothetical protein LXL04_023840 [Taraxacum kok-saghyz]
MFPYGELGWHQHIPKKTKGELRNEGPSTSHASNLITPSQFNNADQLLDMEESVDAMTSGETKASSIGKRVVLPANFIGGPRNMRQKYIDAMALVQKFGKPDIFVTMTCNPNWPEIRRHMLIHEEAHNRPDLAVRVFHAKLEEFKKDILKRHIFGNVVAYTYVVEFQKRGLPHAHFLIILASNSKIYHAEEYDQIVSAEIPDKNTNPHLYKMKKQLKIMMHIPPIEDGTMAFKSRATIKFEDDTGSVSGSMSTPQLEKFNEFSLMEIREAELNGTIVPAIIFSYHLQSFDNIFIPYRKYYVSNAQLIKRDTQFVVGPYEYTWSLIRKTHVLPYAEDTLSHLPCVFNFTPFTELYKFTETGTNICIKALVIKCFPSHQLRPGQPSSKRDIIVVNEEKTSNNLELLELLAQESYKSKDALISYPQESDIVPITIAKEQMKGGKPIWVRGSLSLPTQETNFSITGCANCSNPIEADITWIVICETCNHEVEIQYMSRATLTIEDDSGSICGTITSPQFEKFIPFDVIFVQVAEQITWLQSIATRRFVILNAYKLLQPQVQKFKRQSNPSNGNGSIVTRHLPKKQKQADVNNITNLPTAGSL